MATDYRPLEYSIDYPWEQHPKEVLVFGVNTNHRCDGYTAENASVYFGAKHRRQSGAQGRAYAVKTLNAGVEQAEGSVKEFIQYVAAHPDLTFLLTQSACGLLPFQDSRIATLFIPLLASPHVVFPKSYWAKMRDIVYALSVEGIYDISIERGNLPANIGIVAWMARGLKVMSDQPIIMIQNDTSTESHLDNLIAMTVDEHSPQILAPKEDVLLDEEVLASIRQLVREKAPLLCTYWHSLTNGSGTTDTLKQLFSGMDSI